MQNRVHKRETFYLGGYDPRGARHYYNLYKKEAKLQSKVNNIEMQISTRTRSTNYIKSWLIDSSSQEDHQVMHTLTRYHYMEWDDLVRKAWKKNALMLFWDLLYALKHYVFSGTIIRYAKSAPEQMLAAFYPVIYIFAAIFLSYLVFSFSFHYFSSLLSPYLSVLIGLSLAYGLIHLSIRLGNKIAVFWLLRIYVFALKYILNEDVDLDERLKEFAAYISHMITESEKNEVDEILIVSHSVGTIIAIPILVQLLKSGLNEKDLSKISIMTLGQCIPIVSFLPQATIYREQMRMLVSDAAWCWLDYTTPIDGACFPLMDFYKHSGVKVEESKKPLYLSPRFHTLFSKNNYMKLRKNRHKTHFAYLLATDYRGVYDYFKMTAGHQRLCTYVEIQ